MKRTQFKPGREYYVMWVPVIACSVFVGGALGGLWLEPNGEYLLYPGLVALIGLVALPSIWRSFEVCEEGLRVRDAGGSRLHPWASLGRPRSREVGIRSAFEPGQRMTRMSDINRPTTMTSSTIYDARGRDLYQVGPWIAGRRQLVREVLRRTREQ